MQSRLRRPGPTVWGFFALGLTAAIIVGASWFYVSPPGRQTVTFYTDDAAAIREGDSVRIAGIAVGTVKGVTMEPDQVRVETSIDSAFVGSETQVEVRMLTVVGGYYVNLVSLGDDALGDAPIPRERVRMPYSLTQTLADAAEVTDRVEPEPIRSGVDELQGGLTGARLDSLQSIVDAGNDLVSTIDRQRGQISSILDLSSEYMTALNGYRDQLVELIRKAAIVEQTLTTYGEGFATALVGLGDVGRRIQPVGVFYVNHRDEVLATVAQMQSAAQALTEQLQPTLDDLRGVRTRMEELLTLADPASPKPVLATDWCIPISGGRSC